MQATNLQEALEQSVPICHTRQLSSPGIMDGSALLLKVEYFLFARLTIKTVKAGRKEDKTFTMELTVFPMITACSTSP